MNTERPQYWFRAKRYGLGWGLPLMWQGWVFLLVWAMVLLKGIRDLLSTPSSKRLAFVGVMTILLLIVCYWKGDPRGRRCTSGD
jgi:hypothetical protein